MTDDPQTPDQQPETEPQVEPQVPRNTLVEATAQQFFEATYQQAVAELAGGKEVFNALFAGNQFDMMISFQRLPKGALRPAPSGLYVPAP